MRRGSCHFLVTIVLTSVILFDIFSFFFRPRTRWVFVQSYPHLSHSGFLQVFWRIWLQIWGDMINRSPRASSGQQYLLPCFAWLWNGVRGSRAAVPRGTNSCRTQGDFLSSFHLSIHPAAVPPRNKALASMIKAWKDRFQVWEGRF